MRTFYTKVIALILFSFIYTSAIPTYAALANIDPSMLAAYEAPGEAALALRLSRTDVKLEDVYGVVASELAYKAAGTVEDRLHFHTLKTTEAALTADYLERIGVPALFAGWKVLDVLDTIPTEEQAKDMFNPSATDLFGLTLLSPAGVKLTTIRGTDSKSLHNLLIDCGVVLNNGDIDSAISQIKNHAQEIIERKYFWSNLSARIAASLIPSAVGEVMGNVTSSMSAYTSYVETAAGVVSGAVGGFSKDTLVRHIRSKVTNCIHEVDEFIRANEPDMVVGHSLGGILANSVVRAQEMMGGDAAAMARRIRYIGSFNSTGTAHLVPTVIDILSGREISAASAARAESAPVRLNPALTGEDLKRYREIYREHDVVGAFGKHIGKSVKLGGRLTEEPTARAAASTLSHGGALAVTSPSTAAETHPAPAASTADAVLVAAGGGADAREEALSMWERVSSMSSAAATLALSGVKSVVTSVSTAAAGVASSVAEFVSYPPKDMLADHACSPLVIELLKAYSYKENLRMQAAARAVTPAAVAAVASLSDAAAGAHATPYVAIGAQAAVTSLSAAGTHTTSDADTGAQ